MGLFRKLFRFCLIYGPHRAFVKAVGRTRWTLRLKLVLAPFKRSDKFIAVVGCGQFAFSTIAFFLTKKHGECIKVALDVDGKAVNTFSACYGADVVLITPESDFLLPDVKLVYVASNHASHTDYALRCLGAGVDVYIEKPICVSREQYETLRVAILKAQSKVYFGYNRPFSAAVKELKRYVKPTAFTLNCVVMGHLIPEDHWYREPAEGTRVCGNLGHWIDLSLHLLNCAGGVRYLDILIAYSNTETPDDNISVVLTSDRGDLITLTLTAREEPFEGINETIVFQQDGLFVKVDDFRRASFQLGHKKFNRRYWPKDVGHRKAITQPFDGDARNANEVLCSTELMLEIMEMVRANKASSRFDIDGKL